VQYNDGASGFTAEAAFNYIAASNLLDISNDNIGETSTPSVRLENATAGVTGTQQYSPSIELIGRSWDADTASSLWNKFTIENAAQRQPTDNLDIDSGLAGFRITWQAEGGSVTNFMHMEHDGSTSPGGDSPFPNLFLGINAGGAPGDISGASYGNIGIGHNVLQALAGGDENTSIGYQSMKDCTTCTWNAALGIESLFKATTAIGTTAFGQNAGRSENIYRAVTTADYGLYLGIQASLNTYTQHNYAIAIGPDSAVDQASAGMLGKAGIKWGTGGLTKAFHALDVADTTALGSEHLNEADFSGTTKWNESGDWTIAGGTATWSYSAGWGDNSQTIANMVSAPEENRWYNVTYTINSFTTGVTCSINQHFAPDSGVSAAPVALLLQAQAYPFTHTIHVRSRVTFGANGFVLSCGGSAGEVVFDSISLKQVNDGDIGAAGDVIAFGSLIGGNGVDVASATTTALGAGNVFHITGTTTITTLNTCDVANEGRSVTLIFDGALTFTDGNNLKLAGNLTSTADDTITLACDGSNWYETSRSVN
jgi:hypothetical protein